MGLSRIRLEVEQGAALAGREELPGAETDSGPPRRDVLPLPLAQCEAARLVDEVGASLGVSQQRVESVARVGTGAFGKVDIGDRGEGGGEVDLSEQRVRGRARVDHLWPAHQEWRPRSAFEAGVLARAPGTVGVVVAQALVGVVGVAIVQHGSVVRGEDHERLFIEPSVVQVSEQLADAPVQLDHRVTPRTLPARPFEARVRQTRYVDVVGREHQEPRLALFVVAFAGRGGGEELEGLAGEDVGHVLVHPASSLAAGHPADPRDAVDDRAVVPLGPVLSEGVASLLPARRRIDALAVADLDRVVGIEPDDVAVLEVHARHAVSRGRHQEVVVEAEVGRVRTDLRVPVVAALTETEVPLADDARGVATRPQEVGHGDRLRIDHESRVPRRDSGALLAEGVLAREERVA